MRPLYLEKKHNQILATNFSQTGSRGGRSEKEERRKEEGRHLYDQEKRLKRGKEKEGKRGRKRDGFLNSIFF